MTTQLISSRLVEWLEQHADSLDQSNQHADELLHQLVAGGVFQHGVPTELGGNGSDLIQAIEAISEVARYSLINFDVLPINKAFARQFFHHALTNGV